MMQNFGNVCDFVSLGCFDSLDRFGEEGSFGEEGMVQLKLTFHPARV